MIFRSALIFAALFGDAVSMPAQSDAGRKLLSKARKLEEEIDMTWIINYSIKFASCHSISQYAGAEGNQNAEEGQTIVTQNLVKFKLCPSDSCGYGCKGGEYLVDMAEFVNMYTENRLDAEEMACENVRENCNCQYYDDEDACQNNCFMDAGLDYCIEEEEGDDDAAVAFELQEYLECAELEDENGKYYENGEKKQLYVGPKCSNSGEKIHLGVFTDEFCTQEFSDSAYRTLTGESLPYREGEDSIVAEDCVNCMQADGDDGNYELIEFCEQSYEPAAKCEKNLDIYSPDESGCDFIYSLYRREDSYQPMKHSTAVTMAWVFFVATIVLAFFVIKMFMSSRKKISLNENVEGAVV